jgi:PTS system ascorbate-specific IIA component
VLRYAPCKPDNRGLRVFTAHRLPELAALLVIAHAPLASALAAVAGHCYSEPGIATVDVEPTMSIEAVEALAREAIDKLNSSEVLILADVFGATPCNAAQRVADGVSIRVVAGVNVPMLWRSLCYLREPLDSLVTRAVAGAAQGVVQVAHTRPQNQVQSPITNDPNNSRHQQ